jgi:hypothetical protein
MTCELYMYDTNIASYSLLPCNNCLSLGAHVPTEENDEDTDVDAYFNTAMFFTQQVRILLLHI